jgi:putative salt-induced outer membrane protein YdiY
MRDKLIILMGALLLAFCVGIEASAEKIVLENGDEIDVEIVGEVEGGKVVEHPQLGRIELPDSAIKPPAPPDPEVPGLFGSPVLRGWHRVFGLGLSGSSGVANNFNINASFDVKRETDGYRGLFKSAYFLSQASPDQTVKTQTKTSHEAFVDYNHEFLFAESSFFLFGNARYDYNEFQAYVGRPAGYAGVGYDFINGDTLRFTGKAGGGASYSFGTIDAVAGEGVVTLDFLWNFLEGHEFTWDVSYYPNFSDTPNFRILANAAYVISLVGVDGLALKLGVQDEFNYEVPDVPDFKAPTVFVDGERNSLNYYGNITYEF